MTTTAEPGYQRAYGEILRLEELRDLVCVRDEADHTLFFAAHQACEVWFAVVLRHLESARAALDTADGPAAAAALERLPRVFEVITAHFDVLSTLTRAAFDDIRAGLGTSSGFQSAQYREIEFLCGARDPRFLNITGLSELDRLRLLARLAEPSLAQSFLAYRAGAAAEGDPESVRRVHAALVGIDDAVRAWRSRHAALAEQFLGGAPGTAGSSGAAYLWRSTERTLFPEIFAPAESAARASA